MAHRLILHIQNEPAVIGETDELPSLHDTMVMVNNPRRTDGKELHYLAENVITVYWPVEKINFIEVISDMEEEDIISFVRE
ncbi:hypothetical protein ACFLZW_07005 [Chloroflexota bacterium]